MRRIFRTIAKEFKEAVPPTLFFLVAFHVVAVIRALTEESFGLTPGASTLATVGALIIGKTILIVNKLRVTNWFAQGPLIFSIVWKAMIFALFTTLFQFAEELVPLVTKYGSLRVAAENLISEVVWPRFWSNHIVLLLFLLIYCCAIELVRVFGAEQLEHLFFGIGKPPRRSRAER